MSGPTRAFGRWRLAGLLLVVALAAAACGGATGGGGDDGGGQPSGGQEPAGGLTDLGRQLPQAIQDSGEIRVGSDIAYPPVEFLEGDTPVGIDPDIAAAMGEKLGVKFTFSNSTFDNLIPSLRSQRFDIIMSAMSATEERAQEISFVTYFNVGSSLVVKAGNPDGIQSVEDLCGKTISVQDGTTHEDLANEQATACEAAGQPLEVLTPDTDPEALLDLKGGRSQAHMTDYPVAAYNASTADGGGQYEVIGQQLNASPYGIGIRKEDAQLRDALLQALQAIIADGSYQRVLDKWDAGQAALTTPSVMGA